MALDPPATWGKSIADAVKALGIAPGTPVSDAQLEQFWTLVKTEDTSQLTTKMQATGTTNVTFGSSTGVHPSTIPAGGHT